MSALHRRSLAGVAGVLVAAAAGSAKAASPDRDLLNLVDEFVAHLSGERASLAAMTPEQRDTHSHVRLIASLNGNKPTADTMAAMIARIPSRTPEGVKAKARALLWFHGGTDAGFPYTALGDGLFESVVAEVMGVPCRFHPMSRPSTPGGAT